MKRKRGSSIATVIITFSVLIYLIIPLGKFLFQEVYFMCLKEQAFIAMDVAVFASIANLDTELYSEKKLSIMEDKLQEYFVGQNAALTPKNIKLTLSGNCLRVSFEYVTKSVFDEEDMTWRVESDYLLEITRYPVF